MYTLRFDLIAARFLIGGCQFRFELNFSQAKLIYYQAKFQLAVLPQHILP